MLASYFAQGLNFATILTFPGANLWPLWSVSRLGSFEILMSPTNPCLGRDPRSPHANFHMVLFSVVFMCHVMLNSMPLLGQHKGHCDLAAVPSSTLPSFLFVFQKKVLILIITLLQGAGFFLLLLLSESVSAHEYYDKRSSRMLSGEGFCSFLPPGRAVTLPILPLAEQILILNRERGLASVYNYQQPQ